MKIVFTSQGVAVEMDRSMCDDLDDLKVMLTARLKSATHKEFLEKVVMHLERTEVPCVFCSANRGATIDAQAERDELLKELEKLKGPAEPKKKKKAKEK